MATRPPIPAVRLPQDRMTRSLRGRIESEAQSLLKAVGSAKKLSARDKRTLQGILAPLANATNSDTSAIRLSLSQLDSFMAGFGGAVRRFVIGLGSCIDDCDKDAKSCVESRSVCQILHAACVLNCIG